jgi:hypothetical protein
MSTALGLTPIAGAWFILVVLSNSQRKYCSTVDYPRWSVEPEEARKWV